MLEMFGFLFRNSHSARQENDDVAIMFGRQHFVLVAFLPRKYLFFL